MVVDSSEARPAVCEIDAGKVSFQNPEWSKYVDSMAFETVWSALGAPQWKTKPKCELVKVSIHQPGSRIPSLNGSSNVDGAFATMVIVLPCTFEGGRLRFSYQGKNEGLDLSKDAMLKTSFMAWYNEVPYQAKPLTSGYRLMLSYNIIHTSPGVPKPCFPTMEPAAERLRRVLERWRDGKYTRSASMPLRVHILSRHYPKPEPKTLRRSDYHKALHLLPLAKELGFTVSFATLTYAIDGQNYDAPLPPSPKRRKKGEPELPKADLPVPPMTSVEGRRMSLSDVEEIITPAANSSVDDDKNSESSDEDDTVNDDKTKEEGKEKAKKERLDFSKVEIQEDVVFPKHAFEGKDPDEKTYNSTGYGDISHIYKRTAIVIYRKDDDLKLKLSLKGDNWALEEIQRLSKKDKPSPKARMLAFALLDRLRVFTKTLYPSYKQKPDAETLKRLIRFAWTWEDLELWKSAFPLCTNYCVKSVKGIVDTTLEYFYVADTLPVIKKVLRDTPTLTLRHRLDVVNTVARYEDDEGVMDDLMNVALESYGGNNTDDVETIVKVAKKKGLGVLHDVVIPKVAKRYGVADFFSTLLLALHERRADFPSPPIPTDTKATQFLDINVVIRRCLQEYMTQWNRLSRADLQMVQHITEVGMYVGEVKMVSDFLVRIPNLMDHPTEAKEWYDDAVIPLMDKLRELMKKLEEEVTGENGDKVLVQPKITQEPFRSFFRTAICVYLAYVLGGKESVPSVPPVAVGCGCEDCDELDEFIRGPEVSCRFEAALGERRLDHILSRVKDTKANELVDAFDDESTMEPCSMIIEKKREVVKQYTWAGRQSEAVKFLKHAAHGGEREMMELLGKKAYECAVKAIHGVRPFELSDAEGGDEGDEDEDDVSGDAGPQVPKVGEDVKTNEEPIEVERSDETMADEGEGSQGDRPAKRKREE